MAGFSTKNATGKNTKAVMPPMKRQTAQFVGAEVDDQGNLWFVFKNDAGTYRHKENRIDRSHPSFKSWMEEELMDRVKHIATGFVDAEDIDGIDTGEDESFEGWARQAVEVLRPSFENKEECEIKLVVNPRNFVDFPKYPDFLSTERRPLNWTDNPKYDKYEFSEKKADANPDGKADSSSKAEAIDEEEDF